MNWLTESFAEHSILWMLLSSIVGGVIGASVKFVFDDVLRPWWGWRRETARIVDQYATPLVRSAEALERRINILIRNVNQHWLRNDDYFRLSTLYQFGEYLAWVRILERKFGFLPFESERRGARFNSRLNGFFRAITSHSYFRRCSGLNASALEASAVPRLMLTAIGEVMTGPKDPPAPLEFTEFCLSYAKDPQFQRWFDELLNVLVNAHPNEGLCWDRLIAAAANLRALIVFLDERGRLTPRRTIVNLELIVHPEVRQELEAEQHGLLPP